MKGRKFSNTGLNASELGLIYALKKIFNNKKINRIKMTFKQLFIYVNNNNNNY